MSDSDIVRADPDLHAHGDEHGHGTLKAYLIGFVLSAVLTAIPFALVMAGSPFTTGWTVSIVVACAIVQIAVHSAYFLHLNTSGEGGWTLLAYVFTAVIVVITIAGSLWIMYHLNTNMMPGMPTGQVSQTP